MDGAEGDSKYVCQVFVSVKHEKGPVEKVVGVKRNHRGSISHIKTYKQLY